MATSSTQSLGGARYGAGGRRVVAPGTRRTLRAASQRMRLEGIVDPGEKGEAVGRVADVDVADDER